MLTCVGVTKSYGSTSVLRGVDLTVRPGQVLGLVGSNGAGKTTLISIAAGLRTADSGAVTLTDAHGRTVDALRDPRSAARLIGLAPQTLGVYPMLTVAQNLRTLGELSGLTPAAARARALEVAEAIDLTDKLGARAETLSGGQARRLHTGMALLHRPRVLFLDEPTVGADVAARLAILDVVRSLAADGAAVVYTTHYLTELVDLGADVAILHEGRIVLEAPVDRVLADHARPVVGIVLDGRQPALDELPGWRPVTVVLDPAAGSDPTSPGAAPGTRWEPEPALLDAHDPTALVTSALARLTPATHLRAIEIAPPSLDSAFLSLTGHQLAPTQETSDVLA